ncbi:MAG: 30S ribosomal protein S3 [Candidatus Ancaeobacter aquaticus]|nr:30S ribosomal protein S3 [Candidatus Ancaeobacter aquaticus]
MGQKVNPIGIRVTVYKNWASRWFCDKKDYPAAIHEDLKIRKFIKKRLLSAGISRILIERTADKIRITLHSSRPGVVIGRKGAEIDRIKEDLYLMTKKEVVIDIEEIKRAELDAQLVSENIALQIAKRVSYKRAMKKSIKAAMDAGAVGIKIRCAGRLNGAEIARVDGAKDGKIPLHTLRADIDYGFAESHTTYGLIGVKVWVCKGEKSPLKKKREQALEQDNSENAAAEEKKI